VVEVDEKNQSNEYLRMEGIYRMKVPLCLAYPILYLFCIKVATLGGASSNIYSIFFYIKVATLWCLIYLGFCQTQTTLPKIRSNQRGGGASVLKALSRQTIRTARASQILNWRAVVELPPQTGA
jgi:hypothetical protein